MILDSKRMKSNCQSNQKWKPASIFAFCGVWEELREFPRTYLISVLPAKSCSGTVYVMDKCFKYAGAPTWFTMPTKYEGTYNKMKIWAVTRRKIWSNKDCPPPALRATGRGRGCNLILLEFPIHTRLLGTHPNKRLFEGVIKALGLPCPLTPHFARGRENFFAHHSSFGVSTKPNSRTSKIPF